MSIFRDEVRFRSRIILIITVIAAALLVSWYARAGRRYRAIPEVRFDPACVLRISDVSRIYRIVPDDRDPDRLWIGAREGLFTFNTVDIQWQRYGLDHGLPDETVTALAVVNGVPYAGTPKGLAIGTPASGGFRTLPATVGKNVLAIERYGDVLYYSIDSVGLFLFTPGTALVRPVACSFAKAPSFTCLRAYGDSLFAGVRGLGAALYRPSSGRWALYAQKEPLNRNAQVWDILLRQRALWFGTSDEGVRFKAAGSDTFVGVKNYPCKGAFAFAPETDGFWCGTPWGLWRYYEKGGGWLQFVHPREKTPTEFQVLSIHNTPEQLWWGSRDWGLGYMGKRIIHWQSMPSGLSCANVAAVKRVGGQVYAAYGYQGGHIDALSADSLQYVRSLNNDDDEEDAQVQVLAASGKRLYYGGFESFGYHDPGEPVCRHYGRNSELPAVDVADLRVLPRGRVLLATLTGIVAFDSVSNAFRVVANGFRATCLLPEGDSLWAGSLGTGLRLIDQKSGAVRRQLLEGVPRIVGVARCRGKKGEAFLFAATDRKGCFRVDPATGTEERLHIPDTLLAQDEDNYNDIMAFRQIDGAVWLGTRNSGCIVYYPSENAWRAFTFYDGLLSDQVRGLDDDAQYVWIACYGGLHRVEKSYLRERHGGKGKSG
ncbi:MAG: hypothetical protein V1913_05225 [Fibrobacterota bacterium]